MKYLKRIADNVLKDNLDASGTVLIEGPKWCGKPMLQAICCYLEISFYICTMKCKYAVLRVKLKNKQ